MLLLLHKLFLRINIFTRVTPNNKTIHCLKEWDGGRLADQAVLLAEQKRYYSNGLCQHADNVIKVMYCYYVDFC